MAPWQRGLEYGLPGNMAHGSVGMSWKLSPFWIAAYPHRGVDHTPARCRSAGAWALAPRADGPLAAGPASH